MKPQTRRAQPKDAYSPSEAATARLPPCWTGVSSCLLQHSDAWLIDCCPVASAAGLARRSVGTWAYPPYAAGGAGEGPGVVARQASLFSAACRYCFSHESGWHCLFPDSRHYGSGCPTPDNQDVDFVIIPHS